MTRFDRGNKNGSNIFYETKFNGILQIMSKNITLTIK